MKLGWMKIWYHNGYFGWMDEWMDGWMDGSQCNCWMTRWTKVRLDKDEIKYDIIIVHLDEWMSCEMYEWC